MKWKGRPGRGPRYESYAAASMHFMLACEKLEANTWEHLPGDLKEIEGGTLGYGGWRDLLFHVATGQQMIIYSTTTNPKYKKTKWPARYKPKVLAESAAKAITLLVSLIPVRERKDSFERAMDEMLPKSVRK